MKYCILLLYFIALTFQVSLGKTNNKKQLVDNINDIKDFKKLLRTKTNVLICFYNSLKQSQSVIKLIREVADNVRGEGTIALVDCSDEAKKLCKKLKIPTDAHYILKHYKDGELNKEYDRKLTVASMTNFMRDPTGDIPWEEDSTASDVVHIPDPASLSKFLRREGKPILLLFYAPWCGYCKTLKPEYAQAATELRNEAALAAVDVNRHENAGLRVQYNISGFPTMQYFENGDYKFNYEGENKKDALVKFMRHPAPPPIKLKEPEWSDSDSEVVHLTGTSFDPVIKEEGSVLVMFYAPWCGHCKKMKPEYERAAAQMKMEGVPGMLAAIDATKEQNLAARFSVKGYPTLIYFSHGEQRFDVNVREADQLVDFMRDPKEPPPPPPPEAPWADEVSDVVHLDEENFKPYLKKKKHVLVMFYAPWCGHCKKAKPEFTTAAANFKDDPKVEFAAVDCTRQTALCSANEIRGYPTIKYYHYYTKNVKTYAGGRTSQEFVQFMLDPDRVANTPPSPLKNEWSTDPLILRLNDNNFKKELKKHGIVLVMFYAPWCGHCKKMKPEYLDAAKELAKEGLDNCMAMVDCTENPNVTEEYNIQGFPTIKLFQNGKYITDYNGKRTVADLKQFVSQYYRKKDEL